MNERIAKRQKKLQNYLDDYRYQHTLGVMYTAASLAMCHDEDVEKAMLAGLLHDCAKCIPSDRKIVLCKRNNIPITEVEYDNPGLLHGKLGAFFAKTKYGVSDQEILDAIICHTTGKPAMTKLEKILYIADYIEPGRYELPNIAEVRKLAFTDLDQCVFKILVDSLNHLQSRSISIDPMTANTYEYYKELLNVQ